jgi:glycosyltransferase involved in cell wall biosynthesis
MNLVILVGHFPPGPFGGAEVQAEQWARRLAARHRVTVVTRRDPADQPAEEARDGFRVIRLPTARLPVLRTAADLAGIARTVRALRPAADLLLCFQTFVSGWAGTRLSRTLGIPAVVWIRGEGEYRLGRSALARWVGPRVWRAARGVLVQSESVRGDLLEELGRVAPALRRELEAKIEVVPNGLELPERNGSGRRAAAPGFRVLTIGRLIPEKGMDVVVDAVATLRVGLTVAGDGPERGRLEQRARAAGIDATFAGFVPRARLEELFQEASCVVLAARSGEGLPNVLLEAMAHGLPVVATPVAGVRDLVQHDVNGLLIAPDDAGALRQALVRLASEPDLADRLARAGRASVERFSWDRVAPGLETVLERWSRG